MNNGLTIAVLLGTYTISYVNHNQIYWTNDHNYVKINQNLLNKWSYMYVKINQNLPNKWSYVKINQNLFN